jgi:alanine transaminase
MIPIPQYPLYSADITLFGGTQIPYYLDEEKDWSINEKILEESIEKAFRNGINPKLIVIINPNNPTGSLLSKNNISMVLEFANKHNLTVIADEVYQENIYYPEDKFYSFAKIANDKGIEIPLFSLHSTSKGFIGECGFRGGYLEIRNCSKEILEQLLKVRSIGLCSNTSGQIMTYLMISPPENGSESFDQYIYERDAILSSLGRKSRMIADALNSIEGISCPRPRGAMYLFPKLTLPTNKNYQGKEADFKFCEHLVNDAGIVTVPGSGFGQLPGTNHLRMTFLPPESKIADIMTKFENSYKKFVNSA